MTQLKRQMRMMYKFSILLAIVLLIVACDSTDRESTESGISLRPSTVPTPTLIPSLPTNTMAAKVSDEVKGVEDFSDRPTASPIATVAPPATATPIPAQRIAIAGQRSEIGDYDSSAEQYETALQSSDLSSDQMEKALFGLGKAVLANGQNGKAIDNFSEFLAISASKSEPVEEDSTGAGIEPGRDDAYFFLGQAYDYENDCGNAIEAYLRYLETNPEMVAYVMPRIARCYLIQEDRSEAIRAYESAVQGEAERFTEVSIRKALAKLYEEEANYPAAIDQYDAILNVARTDNTRGEVTYLAGSAELAAGNTDTGYSYYQDAVTNYPQAYESYLALSALVDAGFDVDEFQRGVVDFHANAYDAAIAAFNRYIEANPEHREDVHLYLAWSYEQLGNYDAALAQLEEYVSATQRQLQLEEGDETNDEGQVSASQSLSQDVARGTIEIAKFQARAGFYAEAIDNYLAYLERFPEGPDAPFAAWWAASLYENSGNVREAIEAFQYLAEAYPEHEDAAESLYRAGYLSWISGESDDAENYWQTSAEVYKNRRFGAASLLWLLRTLPEEELDPILEQASQVVFEDYFAIRVRDVASNTAPFEAPDDIDLIGDVDEQDLAEEWLRELEGVEADVDIRSLSLDLAADGRLLRGQKLWRLGLYQEAKRELESLREDYSDDSLASYQLALFLRDLGLYRSSILAATSIMRNAGVDAFGAPKYIAKLAYPIHYADLVLAEADNYGFDPLLMFALIRQESLFESIAQSNAAAQGLSQVIPDTGAYIAQRLGWQDYDNEDLFRPYVGIAFGAYYLDQQLDSFDGDVAAALSAYNGGPGNAARWYGQVAGDIDAYIETVDFAETRAYIERIYTGQSVYKYLYDN